MIRIYESVHYPVYTTQCVKIIKVENTKVVSTSTLTSNSVCDINYVGKNKQNLFSTCDVWMHLISITCLNCSSSLLTSLNIPLTWPDSITYFCFRWNCVSRSEQLMRQDEIYSHKYCVTSLFLMNYAYMYTPRFAILWQFEITWV